ncbi:MAG TPA: polysaccharide biosynthesis tyrosine autokinase, partial [Acidimicrobiales bacterium]|nr:polysaccharide biosynthesis tyrosine autokinase [Acidimicrobiales bacterium]
PVVDQRRAADRRVGQRLTAGMELRAYRDILRRRLLLVVTATVVAATVAGVASRLKTPVYTARAEVLLRPGDPAEELYADRAPGRPAVDPDRYVATQLDIVESKAVAQAAAQEVGGDPDGLLRAVSASQPASKDLIVVSARDRQPERAAQVANAFARAYIENRREAAVAALDRASEQLQGRLAELSALLATPEGTAPDAAPSPAQRAAADQYQSLYARQQELLVERTLKRGEAELISDAEVPPSPSSPRPVRNAALGALVGLLAGLGYAFLREQLDDRLHTREQFEEAAGLPVLAELPRHREAPAHAGDVAVHAHPASPLAEAVRKLRTAVTFLTIEAPLRLIAVTSPGRDEGKSFTAAGLAAVYAQAGLRTILVSADLRRPGVDSLFPEAGGGPGLSGAVSGFVPGSTVESNGSSASDASVLGARPTRVEGLSFLPSGELPPNPAELLGSANAARFFQALTRVADVVVVDTPPVLVTDAAVVASHMDGILLVAVPGSTTRDALARATTTLQGSRARLLGVVLNKVRAGDADYYGRYDDHGHRPAGQPRHRRRRAARERAGRRTG